MATATKSKTQSSSSSSSSSSSKSSARTAAEKVADSIHQMRAEYTNPPVDTPVDVAEAVSEVKGTDGKSVLRIVSAGGGAEVTASGSVLLDRDGILAAQRAFSRLGSSV